MTTSFEYSEQFVNDVLERTENAMAEALAGEELGDSISLTDLARAALRTAIPLVEDEIVELHRDRAKTVGLDRSQFVGLGGTVAR